MAKVFLDTNVFIDAIHRQPEKQILDSLLNHVIYISPLSFHIYCYIYKIKVPNKKVLSQKDKFQIVDFSQEIAEDLTSDTFLKAWRDFSDKGIPPDHWLTHTARNLATDHWRNTHGVSDTPRPPLISLDMVYQSTDQFDPSDLVERKIVYEQLTAALAKLNSEWRNLIIRRFIYGQPHEEVAGELGRSVVAVRQMQKRALRQLKKLMEGVYNPGTQIQ